MTPENDSKEQARKLIRESEENAQRISEDLTKLKACSIGKYKKAKAQFQGDFSR